MPAINTNTSALNAQRLLGNTSRMFGRSVARLSSGLRINRAGDDAAGLGIANRISADVRGLRQAARNAEQANSMLQVAEGGVQQIQGIIERMKELATQAASDNSGDRAVLDQEFGLLRAEISRIVGTTEFQGRKMLNGSFGNTLDAASNLLTANNNVQTSSVKAAGAAAGTYTISVINGNDARDHRRYRRPSRPLSPPLASRRSTSRSLESRSRRRFRSTPAAAGTSVQRRYDGHHHGERRYGWGLPGLVFR